MLVDLLKKVVLKIISGSLVEKKFGPKHCLIKNNIVPKIVCLKKFVIKNEDIEYFRSSKFLAIKV